jgi:hypothetical protein
MFLIDVIGVVPLSDRRLAVTFEDGLEAVLEMDGILKTYDGVFAPLLDPDFFSKVVVDPELGTIVWPNGADLCPDVLYSHASGKVIPECGSFNRRAEKAAQA